VVAGGFNHLGHAVLLADIARIKAQAGGAGLGGFNRALIMKMNIRHNRHTGPRGDLFQRLGAVFIRAGDADNIGPRRGQLLDLLERAGHIGG